MPSAFHVHVYFRDARERHLAFELRHAFTVRFPTADLGRVHDSAVAFHPAPMYQVTLDGAPLGTLIPWLQRHRGTLSLMVHPLTGDVRTEHLDDAIWLGRPLALDEDRLHDAASTAPPTSGHSGPTILRIDASARRRGSQGRTLGDALIERLSPSLGGARVIHRDLANGIPLLDTEALEAWSIDPNERTRAHTSAAAFSDALIAELEAADAIVIALPIYNFQVPAAFKAWIDLVARARVTFRYGARGPVGLLADRPVYVIVTSGGTRLDGPLDFVTPWLTHVLGFLGLSDVRWIRADGLGSDAETRLAEARAAITDALRLCQSA